jgi:hypothetical protein
MKIRAQSSQGQEQRRRQLNKAQVVSELQASLGRLPPLKHRLKRLKLSSRLNC